MTDFTNYPAVAGVPGSVPGTEGPPGPATPLPTGTAIRRFAQVSNAANSTSVPGNTNTMLPLNNDGAFAFAFNSPAGKCSVDATNDWIDVSGCSQYSDLEARVTFRNTAGGTVTGQLVMRLIPNKATPNVGFTDILTGQITFSTTNTVLITAYQGTTQAVRIGIRTTSNETIELQGVYFKVIDIA